VFDVSSLLVPLDTIGRTVLSFVQEDNRNREALRQIEAQRALGLAARGFTAAGSLDPSLAALASRGAVGFSPPPLAVPSVNLGGGGGTGFLSSVVPLLPWLIGGVVLLKVLK
jgi:hypothetical protein